MLMYVVKMPRNETCWYNKTRYESIASTLLLKRYKKVHEFPRVAHNTEKDKPENQGDKCFKVKPLLEAVSAYCNKIEPKANNSIDEEIIPAKTKRVAVFICTTLKCPINGGSKI